MLKFYIKINIYLYIRNLCKINNKYNANSDVNSFKIPTDKIKYQCLEIPMLFISVVGF